MKLNYAGGEPDEGVARRRDAAVVAVVAVAILFFNFVPVAFLILTSIVFANACCFSRCSSSLWDG